MAEVAGPGAQQLAPYGVEAGEQRLVDTEQLVTRSDPAVGVRVEERLARRPEEVVAARVPESPVEDHRGPGPDEQRRLPVGPFEAVAAVTAGDHVQRSVVAMPDVGEEVRRLQREQRPRRGQLDVLPPAVLMPAPGRLRRRSETRVHVEMAMVEKDVPAEHARHELQDLRVIDELDELRVQADEPEQMERAAVATLLPDAIDRVDEPATAIGIERVLQDGEPVVLERLVQVLHAACTSDRALAVP